MIMIIVAVVVIVTVGRHCRVPCKLNASIKINILYRSPVTKHVYFCRLKQEKIQSGEGKMRPRKYELY